MPNSNSLLTNCPACGAVLPQPPPDRCPYCSTSLRQSRYKTASPSSSVKTEEIQWEPAKPRPAEDLTPLAAARQRPRPKPAHNPGCGGIALGTFFTLFASIFIVVGIMTYMRDRQEYTLLQAEGQKTQARITDRDYESDDDGETYYVTFTYKVRVNGDLQNFTERVSVTNSLYNALPEGAQTTVIYAPSDPSIVRLEAGFNPPSVLLPIFFTLIPLIFIAVGIWMIAGGIESMSDERSLKRRGQDALATVTEIWDETDSEGDRTTYIAYTFQAQDRHGSSQTVDCAEKYTPALRGARVGKQLMVRYLPDNPRIARLVRD